ncbi:endonuclease MutS2 [Sandaracinomonas limnophila]|uniref:Endonuclease MutS2 n=1 Tax=Sandaracinomonas limnophila TaxID=1862386 RepID=A0A437PQX3_9BACT|nr:Smr/MutS family protein [Sandaracinomonas limnophila]RVU24649.1 endonuclease MutS2 [Sandaracinomonas limnophila]
MNYPNNLADKLGFEAVQEQIKEHCISVLGQEYAEKMKFSNKFHLVKQWVEQVAEMKDLLAARAGEWPQTDYIDLRPWLGPLSLEGNYLSPEAWRDWQRALDVLYKCIRFFENLSEETSPNLRKLTQHYLTKNLEINLDYRAFLPVIQALGDIFDPSGQIKESASPVLGEIRRKKITEELGLRKKLDQLLSTAQKEGWVSKDFSLTLRNGRMVIPIAAEHKRKIKGFVQDESDTGKTVFLEPADALTANNEIKSLESAERREIQAILAKLSERVRPLVPMIEQWMNWLGLIDFIRAKALWAVDHKAIMPEMEEKQEFLWKEARHPLLEISLQKMGKSIKPLNIQLSTEQRIMVVSGPNAGGKSVTLSTIGLLQYIFQTGCLVPVKEQSKMGFFHQIFLDMGDDQNLENELSTYSSHLSNMRYFLENANPKTLLLVDEFGTGTEPGLGGAIAEAILEKLADKGSYGAINTHYGNLKNLADHKKGLFNAAMKYDTVHLEPLYELEIGKPGSSFAFEIAHKIGLPDAIIQSAQKKINKKQVDFDKLLVETSTEKQLWESKNAALEERIRQSNSIKEQYETLKTYLDEEKKNMLNLAKIEAKKLVKEANQKIEQTIRVIKEKEAEKESTKKVRLELANFVETKLKSEQSEKLKVENFNKSEGLDFKIAPSEAGGKSEKWKVESGKLIVGDWVLIENGTNEPTLAQILELKSKDAVVALGGIKSTVKLNRLTKVKAPKQEKKKYAASTGLDLTSKMAHFSHTLDLRGKRGEEVYGMLDHYLNDAILTGVIEVKILHGKGDGILRNLVREQLRRYPQVRKFEDEHADRGGAGVTIVSL